MDRKTGRRMAAARVEAGLSTGEMASIVGRSVAAIHAYERAVNEPPGSVMNEWAKATGKPLAYFYGETAPTTSEAQHHPGLEALAKNAQLRARHHVTDAEIAELRLWRTGKPIQTVEGALSVVQALRHEAP